MGTEENAPVLLAEDIMELEKKALKVEANFEKEEAQMNRAKLNKAFVVASAEFQLDEAEKNYEKEKADYLKAKKLRNRVMNRLVALENVAHKKKSGKQKANRKNIAAKDVTNDLRAGNSVVVLADIHYPDKVPLKRGSLGVVSRINPKTGSVLINFQDAQILQWVRKVDLGKLQKKVIRKRKPAPGAMPQARCPELASIPTFVLNLDRRTDRLANMTALLQRKMPWNKQACRVSAPDGRALGQHMNPSLVCKEVWDGAMRNEASDRVLEKEDEITRSSLALVLGHARIWERVAQSKAPFGIVMEDDIAYLNPHIDKLLCKLANATADSHEWEYLQMQVPPWISKPDPEEKHPSLLQTMRLTYVTTGMYLITPQASMKALDAYFPICSNRTLDAERGFLRSGLEAYSVFPTAAMQRSDMLGHIANLEKDSDIGYDPAKRHAESFLQLSMMPDCQTLPHSKIDAMMQT